MAEDREPIDLNKLTARELLIVVATKQEDMERNWMAYQEEQRQEHKDVKEELHDMSLKVNTLETKSKVWGGVGGFVSGMISGIIAAFVAK